MDGIRYLLLLRVRHARLPRFHFKTGFVEERAAPRRTSATRRQDEFDLPLTPLTQTHKSITARLEECKNYLSARFKK